MYDQTVYTNSPGLNWIWIVIGLSIAVVLIVGIALVVLWIKKKFSHPEMYGLSREQVQKQWQQIKETSHMNGQMGLKLALVEADTLLDSALKSIMMPGSTLGERLKMACYRYPKLKDVWSAHKLRNQLVHDSSFRLNDSQVRRALDEFESALKVLNIL